MVSHPLVKQVWMQLMEPTDELPFWCQYLVVLASPEVLAEASVEVLAETFVEVLAEASVEVLAETFLEKVLVEAFLEEVLVEEVEVLLAH